MVIDDTKPSVFGDLLRDHREKINWSRSELARQLTNQGYSITVSAISKYEKGHRRPGGDIAVYLKKSFGWNGEGMVDACLEALSSDYLEELYDQYYTALK